MDPATSGGGDLATLVRAELAREAPAPARVIAAALHERFGAGVAAIVFYGSCLRRGTAEGILDFYVIVDDYRAAYTSRALAWANALLPPNVFYLERATGDGTVHAKVAVMSQRDFARAMRPETLRPGFWARFCQPALAVYTRDAQAEQALVAALVRATLTAGARALGLCADRAGRVRASVRELWLALLRDTYASELRTERDATVQGIVDADPPRNRRVLEAALQELAARGSVEALHWDGERVACDAPALRLAHRGLRRLLARTVGLAQLLKSAFTFGDWLPYALWKLERHTGTRLEVSERQRRHPFLFAWPLFLRVLVRRDLR